MVIQPKVRGFLCTTTHPTGCLENVRRQVAHVQGKGEIAGGPKRVLVLGASTGYGLASRITAAFGSGAATLAYFSRSRAANASPVLQVGITRRRFINWQSRRAFMPKASTAMRSRTK